MASLYKRTWVTPAGEAKTAWRVKYWVKGKDRSRQFAGERAAKKFITRLETITAREIAVAESEAGLTVAMVAEEWLIACERGRHGLPPLEPETLVWYRGHVVNYILPILGARRIRGVGSEHVKTFRDELLEPHRQLSRNTAKKILTTLKTLIGFAVEEGYLTGDPSVRIGIRLSHRDRPRVEIHSKVEMTAILAAADHLRASPNQQVARTWDRYTPLLHLLVYAGLRLSEVRGLERDSVDTRARTIEVCQRADKRGRIGAPKSAKGNRRVQIPQDTAVRLERWLVRHRHPLVFATRTGRPINGDNVRKRLWETVQAAAEVRVLTLHSARHFYASRQIELGANIKQLSERMGHSDEAFTLRVYGHLFRDAVAEAQALEQADASLLVLPRA